MTADEMDEQRKQNVAYEYLCHLEEAKVLVFGEKIIIEYPYNNWGEGGQLFKIAQ